MKPSLITRIIALGSSIAITFALVSLLADYGLPQADDSVQLASAPQPAGK